MTKTLLRIFTPFGKVDRWTKYGLIAFTAIALILFWQVTRGDRSLLPGPFAVVNRFLEIAQTKDFVSNLFSSIGLIFKAMLVAIIIALLVGYLSVIPFFNPLARFIMKLRYLTISGLYFAFALLSKDADTLKLSLLIFGIVPFFVTSLMEVICNIQKEEFDSCRTLRYSNWETLYELIIIGRMDQTLEIIRQNFAIAWMMIVTVECASLAGGGIGVMMFKFSKFNDLQSVFSLLIVILVLGILIDWLLGVMRRELFPYTKYTTSED
jgi:ABC-type nitrate/sulfonate/bicarbonate transport system permease component